MYFSSRLRSIEECFCHCCCRHRGFTQNVQIILNCLIFLPHVRSVFSGVFLFLRFRKKIPLSYILQYRYIRMTSWQGSRCQVCLLLMKTCESKRNSTRRSESDTRSFKRDSNRGTWTSCTNSPTRPKKVLTVRHEEPKTRWQYVTGWEWEQFNKTCVYFLS